MSRAIYSVGSISERFFSREVVDGLSEPLEDSGTSRRANANPSPVAPCLSVCWADNVDSFHPPALLSRLLPFVSAAQDHV